MENYRQIERDIDAEGHCALVDTSQWFDAAGIYDECYMPDTLYLEHHRRLQKPTAINYGSPICCKLGVSYHIFAAGEQLA